MLTYIIAIAIWCVLISFCANKSNERKDKSINGDSRSEQAHLRPPTPLVQNPVSPSKETAAEENLKTPAAKSVTPKTTSEKLELPKKQKSEDKLMKTAKKDSARNAKTDTRKMDKSNEIKCDAENSIRQSDRQDREALKFSGKHARRPIKSTDSTQSSEKNVTNKSKP